MSKTGFRLLYDLLHSNRIGKKASWTRVIWVTDKTIIFNITQRGDESFYTLSLPQDNFGTLYARRVVRGSLLSRNHVSKKPATSQLSNDRGCYIVWLCGWIRPQVFHPRKTFTIHISRSFFVKFSSSNSVGASELWSFSKGKKAQPSSLPNTTSEAPTSQS